MRENYEKGLNGKERITSAIFAFSAVKNFNRRVRRKLAEITEKDRGSNGLNYPCATS